MTSIAFFLGWREESAYYQTIGAPWAMPMIPRFTFLDISSAALIVIILSLYASLYTIANQKHGVRTVFWIGSAIMILAVVLPIVPDYLPLRWTNPKSIWFFAICHSMALYIATGALIGEAVARFRDASLKWSEYTIHTLYLAIFYGILVSPRDLGAAKANYHLAEPATALPSVSIFENDSLREWRLVEIMGLHALLLHKSDKQKPVFRIVLLKEISFIASSEVSSKSLVGQSQNASPAPYHGDDLKPTTSAR